MIDSDETTGRDSIPPQYDTASVAASLRTDFFQLVRIFESQLEASGNRDDCTTIAIADAKAAAERGLSLTNALLDFLESSRDQD